MMHRPEYMVTRGEQFFKNGFSIYVNQVSERFELPEHAHDFFEISYVLEGSGFHYIGDQTIRVTKGDLFYLPIGVTHIFRPTSADPNKPLIIGNCIFDEQLFRFLTAVLPEQFGMYRFQRIMEEKGAWLQMRERISEFAPIFESLLLEFEQKRTGYQTMMCGLLLQLLIGMERALGDEKEPISFDHERMDAVMRCIRSRMHDKLTLSDAARDAGMGTRQLQRMIAKSTGRSFSELVAHERIEHSCRLLKDQAMRGVTIADIASSVGIHDPKRFYRLFKNKTGTTPASYRKEGGIANPG
ncbi:AraC family transcriptional regulator [Paenibacillus guangzhouensis]|uniref:AraC family transcriptional regulator n=1 Tax=Paenibacillus guangzhouensis TaxID=1473112 RepID=UPI00187B882E|nr:AraC family transcriptional regulator [Paenibacillus guangzhouensis]